MPEGAVYVGRPTKFGNPWSPGGDVDFGGHHNAGTEVWFGRRAGETVEDAAEAVALYRRWLDDCASRGVPLPISMLRGKDLVCWCPPAAPCHADVLLELANDDRRSPVGDEIWVERISVRPARLEPARCKSTKDEENDD